MPPFTFDDAVASVKSNPSSLPSLAHTLFKALTPSERLRLLDGDEPFWPGLQTMTDKGYNRHPYCQGSPLPRHESARKSYIRARRASLLVGGGQNLRIELRRVVLETSSLCLYRDPDTYAHGSTPRLSIPGVLFTDGPRGIVLGASTAFPVPMARGATWDSPLEERIGLAIGREGRAQGANFFGGVCVNLPRHPAWGRIQETYGEDPVLLGEMGAALTRGVQRNLMACVKHFALNSMENARFQVDVDIEDDVLREVYLAHFRRIVEEGVASVMSSYNSVRGEWAGQNKELLLDILREEWGFKGFVISDFLLGLRDGPLSLKNGLDIEAPYTNIRGRTLEKALEDRTITESDVERAGLAILRTQIEAAAREENPAPQPDIVFCEEHRKLAREAAVKSMVLLKNQAVDGSPFLPLSEDVTKVAVIGRLADAKNTGDKGSSAVRCPEVVTPYEGLKAALPQTKVTLEASNDPSKAGAAAASADVAVVIVGYDWKDEGEFITPPFKTNPELKELLPPSDGSKISRLKEEATDDAFTENTNSPDHKHGFGAGGDRTSLRLKIQDVELIRAVTEANPRTVVVIVAAGAVIMSEWDDLPPAILYSWYAGSEGGHALADILLGRATPGGHLPFSIPTDEKHLPFFDKNAMSITYDRWFGQNLLDRLDVKAAYPLGFGLSYTSFAISDLKVNSAPASERIRVNLKVKNTGQRAGRYVAQVYGAASVPDRPRRSLLGFHSVDLEEDQEKEIQFEVSTRPLQKWDKGIWTLWTASVEVQVGDHSGSQNSLNTILQL
ncbi:hypothetical protein ACHAQH_009255 [Verticillium albo-atrum]